MKYIVKPLYIREAILLGPYKTFKMLPKQTPISTDKYNSLEDHLRQNGLLTENLDFPQLTFLKFYVCSNDFDDYDNFKDFDDVNDFLITNSSDWQEAGLFNSAHLLVYDDDNNLIDEKFYSANTKSFVDFSINKGYYHLSKSNLRLMEQKIFDTKKVIFNRNEIKKYKI